MTGAHATSPIWACDPVTAAEAGITRFAAEAGARAGLDLGAYRDLLAWSVRDLDAFSGTVADFFGLGLGDGPVLADPPDIAARRRPDFAGPAAPHA